MKNKYNSTKTQLESKYIELKNKIAEADEVLRNQKLDVEKYEKCVEAHRKQVGDRRREFKEKLSELVKETSLTND